MDLSKIRWNPEHPHRVFQDLSLEHLFICKSIEKVLGYEIDYGDPSDAVIFCHRIMEHANKELDTCLTRLWREAEKARKEMERRAL